MMAGRLFLDAKEVFYTNILKLGEWLNDKKQFFFSSL